MQNRLSDLSDNFKYIEMKRIVRHIFVTALAMTLSSAAVFAQEYVSTPVEISKERVKIDGKICYSHIVLEKQTLYSISKAYGVSLEDIYRFNPTVKESGLKKNSIIIIPSPEALKEEPESGTPKNTRTAEKAETKKEQKSVTEKDAEKKQEKAQQEIEKKPVKEKAQRIHIAKWYEDLDVISEQYGVSVEEIMTANNLKGRKLTKRQKLIIPFPGETEASAPEESDMNTVAEAVQEESQIPVVETDTLEIPLPKTKVDVTLMLPLTTADGKSSRNNMDFYCGALLAVYDLAESGTDCNLNVYDIHRGESQTSVESLKNSDVIIGPVSSADLTQLFNTIGEQTLVVSPLDPRAEKLTVSHSSMVQIPTPQSAQYKDLVKWVEDDFSAGDRVVMITEKGARQSTVTTVMKEALDSSSLIYKTFSYSILEGRDVTRPLTELMGTEGKNRILVASESEAFVNDVIRNLNLLVYNNIDITIYAPSKIRGFETIEVENLHNTSMHVSLAYYIDYDNPKVKNFLLKYRALFNTEPNQFAFQGYDVADYFIRLCSKYGADWRNHIESQDKDMLQSSFRIRKERIGGYLNTGVRRIVYENGYSVKTIR